MKCAGCGREVEMTRNSQWGEVIRDRPRTISYVCDWGPGEEPGTQSWADYHYVEGETQRKFRAP